MRRVHGRDNRDTSKAHTLQLTMRSTASVFTDTSLILFYNFAFIIVSLFSEK